MSKISTNSIIGKNKILLFFIDEKKSTFSKILKVIVVFFLIPLILIGISFKNETLFLSEKEDVGMFDDSLFMFIVFVVPLQLIILNFIIKKFIVFIEETINFTKTSEFSLHSLIEEHLKLLNRRRNWLIFVKVALFSFILFSNIKSLYSRQGAWNSFNHQISFYLTLLVVVFIIISLIEIVTKLALIIWVQMKFTSELSKNNLIEIEPLSLDKSGSLKSLGDLSLSFTYMLIPFSISSLTHYLTWGQLTMGFVFGLVALAFSSVFMFFFPLGTVHSLMSNSKKIFLQSIDDEYLVNSGKLLVAIKVNGDNINELRENGDTLKNMYDLGKQMPVWPFDLKIIAKFFTVLLGPFLLIILEHIAQNILSGVL